MLTESIRGAVQVAGSDSEDDKRSRLIGFSDGTHRALVTKPKIAGFGMNWQHCHNIAYVGLSHSWEQFYQTVRRCWRFGQKRPVTLDVIATEGEVNVQKNMDRKERLADQMFEAIVQFMNESQRVTVKYGNNETEMPTWLAATK